jgi:hypothetical protein
MTERSGALQEDPLYMSYAQIIAKSCGEEEEEGGDEEPAEGGGEEEAESGASIHVSVRCILTSEIFGKPSIHFVILLTKEKDNG